MRKELREGVFLASVVAKPRNGVIPVEILNTTSLEVVCTMSDTSIDVNALNYYDYCYSDEPELDVERVKEVFSLLKLDYLNSEYITNQYD